MKLITVNMITAAEEGEDDEINDVATPAQVNVDYIRTFYARRVGRPGTRITFSNGSGFAVTESPEDIAALIAGA